MLWSGPRSQSSGAVALEQRGENIKDVPESPWDAKDGTDILPPRGIPNRYNSTFYFFYSFGNNERWHHHGRFLTRRITKKHLVTSAFQSRTRCRPWYDHTSLVVSSPIASASFLFKLYTPRLLTSPTTLSLPQWRLFFTTGSRGCCSRSRCCCCRRAKHPHWRARCSKPQVIRRVLSIPFGRFGLNSD